MGNPIDMNYNQRFLGVPKFMDDAGVERPVDAIRWTLADAMGGVFTQEGNNVSYVADATMVAGGAPRSSQVRAEVDENGVVNAFFDTFDLTVHGPPDPAATHMEMAVQVSDQ